MTRENRRWLDFRQVDVFTEEPYAGNPLAVVLDADGLTTQRMQAIAAEMNLSETAFVSAAEVPGADYRLRIFTPARELPFAGHPSIGAAYVMLSEGRFRSAPPPVTLHQQVNIGVLPIELEVGSNGSWRIVMTQGEPRFGEVIEDQGRLSSVLSVPVSEIVETGLPTQIVSTGLQQLFVPVRSLAAVAEMKPHLNRLAELEEAFEFTGCLAFCLETRSEEAFAHVRYFTPSAGISEDPATGSAAGGLGAYFVRYGVVDRQRNPVTFQIEQGIEMGRPSRLHVEVTHDGSMPTKVRVGGTAVTVARGRLFG